MIYGPNFSYPEVHGWPYCDLRTIFFLSRSARMVKGDLLCTDGWNTGPPIRPVFQREHISFWTASLWKIDSYFPGKSIHIPCKIDSYSLENRFIFLWKINSYHTGRDIMISFTNDSFVGIHKDQLLRQGGIVSCSRY